MRELQTGLLLFDPLAAPSEIELVFPTHGPPTDRAALERALS